MDQEKINSPFDKKTLYTIAIAIGFSLAIALLTLHLKRSYEGGATITLESCEVQVVDEAGLPIPNALVQRHSSYFNEESQKTSQDGMVSFPRKTHSEKDRELNSPQSYNPITYLFAMLFGSSIRRLFGGHAVHPAETLNSIPITINVFYEGYMQEPGSSDYTIKKRMWGKSETISITMFPDRIRGVVDDSGRIKNRSEKSVRQQSNFR